MFVTGIVWKKEFHLVLYRRVNLIPLEIFNNNCLLRRRKKKYFKNLVRAIYVNKDEARQNSLKTNENKTVSILDSYYNNTNLNLCKKEKFIWKRLEHFTEVSVMTIQKEILFSFF